VLGTDPTYREALNNLGGVYVVLGREEEAMKVYGRAVAAHPNFAAAYFNLGRLKLGQDHLAEGAAFLKRALELYADAPTYYELGNAYVRQKQLGEAAKAYRQASRLDGQQVQYLYNLGEVLLGLGQQDWETGDELGALQRWGEARTRFQQVVGLDPGFRGGGAQLRLRQLEERLP
jgi:protein O-GlcNAc transferase